MNYKEALFFIGKCLTISYEEHNKIAIQELIKTNTIDWESIVKVSTKHYIFPALYCNLKRADLLHYLPNDLVEYMKHITDLNRERNLEIIEQAKEINELLLANNITPIFLKGTGNLLEELYDDLAERMVGDIDFIVSEENFTKSVEILKKNGYLRTETGLINPVISKHYPRMYHETKIAAVEVHIRMLREGLSQYFNYNSIHSTISKHNSCYVLSNQNKLVLTILANQFNDFGYYYKKFSLRNSYDAYLLTVKKSATIQNHQHQKIRHLINNYLSLSAYIFNSKKIACKEGFKEKLFKKIVLTKLKNSFFRKAYNNILKSWLYLYLKTKGAIRFMTNTGFRNYYLKKKLGA